MPLSEAAVEPRCFVGTSRLVREPESERATRDSSILLIFLYPPNRMGRASIDRLLTIALTASWWILNKRLAVITQSKNIVASGHTEPATNTQVGINTGNFCHHNPFNLILIMRYAAEGICPNEMPVPRFAEGEIETMLARTAAASAVHASEGISRGHHIY